MFRKSMVLTNDNSRLNEFILMVFTKDNSRRNDWAIARS